MDPLSAFALMVKALAELATEAMKGQTPQQREKIWDWYIRDTERWRKFWKLDDATVQKLTSSELLERGTIQSIIDSGRKGRSLRIERTRLASKVRPAEDSGVEVNYN